MERRGIHKALRTVLWFIFLSLSRGLWMGCFREVGTLGNLTHCCYLWGWGVAQAYRTVWGRQEGGQGTLGMLVCWGWQLQMSLSDVTPVGCRCWRTQETALRALSLTLSPVPPALSRWTDLKSCWATSTSLADGNRVTSPPRIHPSTLERK